ncbi:LapA family protein [Jannaschia sp. S6380]|uniref:LapA family protein n=1 Tax=Jannaschia sp. S6380 TaxID=2926408 RepID=UPI001FF17B88|nr:LapA family protein [Jannaschia sp. S6380]MCK0167549.1 LapA family protein [Jannaschia sp. S6380]
MSFLRYLFLGLLALCLLILALANRGAVTLRLLPEDVGTYIGFGQGFTAPLFVVIFLAMAVGLMIGFFWEWLREHKHRAEARSERAQKERLEKELARTRATSEQDEVLALVDNPR